eukprot:TRINITY_DN2421_c0_g1_i1.p1 TRINITY_DN2421_c0_g1~~TRINITY_DN2421_c0_g1_i1.p1  ORF type:complete len:253 (-),score=34.40 TRINITY_DN2421_c0_g1_i1:242-1000(-)
MVCARGFAISLVVLAASIGAAHSAAVTLLGGAGPTLTCGTTAAGAAGSAAAGSTAAGTAAAGTAAAGTAAAGTAAGTAAAAAGAAAAGTAAGTAAQAAGGVSLGSVATVAVLRPWWAVKQVAIFSGLGIALVTLGADLDNATVTWDCWKPLLHDTSTAPSRGRLVADILTHPVINGYRIESHAVFVRNRWNEYWRIDPLVLPWGQVAAHATRLESTNRTFLESLVDEVVPSAWNTTDAHKTHSVIGDTTFQV